jgi:hypothetical protein
MIAARIKAEGIEIPVVAREHNKIGFKQTFEPAPKPSNQSFICR